MPETFRVQEVQGHNASVQWFGGSNKKTSSMKEGMWLLFYHRKQFNRLPPCLHYRGEMWESPTIYPRPQKSHRQHLNSSPADVTAQIAPVLASRLKAGVTLNTLWILQDPNTYHLSLKKKKDCLMFQYLLSFVGTPPKVSNVTRRNNILSQGI